MEFQAKRVELDFDVEVLNGEKVHVEPKRHISTQVMLEMYEQWNDVEERFKDDKTKTPFEIIAIQLAMLYDKPKEWWLDNIDPATLNEIMVWCVSAMMGTKKNDKSSNSASPSLSSE